MFTIAVNMQQHTFYGWFLVFVQTYNLGHIIFGKHKSANNINGYTILFWDKYNPSTVLSKVYCIFVLVKLSIALLSNHIIDYEIICDKR